MSCLDRLQQAWQSQPDGTLGINPDQLLKVVRLERRTAFWCDIFVVSVFLWVLVVMLRAAFRDIQVGWPWLFSALSEVWVAAYILYNRWGRRRDAAHCDETLLAHIDGSIKDIEHQIRLERNQLWWYVLPIAVVCMLPPILFFAMDYSKKRELDLRYQLLFGLGCFAATFIVVYLVMKYAGRIGLETRRRELRALRALRETLLNSEE